MFDVPRGEVWDDGGVAFLDKFPCFKIKPNVPDYDIRIGVSFGCWKFYFVVEEISSSSTTP